MERKIILSILLSFAFVGSAVAAWGFGSGSDHGKVLLQDVKTLTLYADRMTTGRRSSPVPQLTCVGGSAQGQFKPQVVQCYNRGWDGSDVQWECKSDMDNAYRFGRVEVVCEGYDYPDDPYILKGSCGLEYTLDYTQEGDSGSVLVAHNYQGISHPQKKEQVLGLFHLSSGSPCIGGQPQRESSRAYVCRYCARETLPFQR